MSVRITSVYAGHRQLNQVGQIFIKFSKPTWGYILTIYRNLFHLFYNVNLVVPFTFSSQIPPNLQSLQSSTAILHTGLPIITFNYFTEIGRVDF